MHLVGAELFDAGRDGRTDMTKRILRTRLKMDLRKRGRELRNGII